MKKFFLIILIYIVSLGNSTNLEKLNIKDDGLIYKKKKLYTGQVFIDVKAPIIEGNQLNFYFLKKITKGLKKEIKNRNINLVSKGKKVGKWFEYSPNYIFQYYSNYVDGVREVINIEKNINYRSNSEIYKYLDLLNEIELIIPGYADIIYAERLIGKTVTNDLNMYFFNKIRKNFEINKTTRKFFEEPAFNYLTAGHREPLIQSIEFSSQTNYYEDAHNGRLFALSNNSALGITKKWNKHRSKDPSSLVLFRSVGLRGKEKNQINFHRYAMIDQNEIYIDSINYFIDENKLEPYRDDYYKVSVLDSVTYFDLLLKSSYIKPYENQALILLGDTTIASNNGIIEIKKDGKKFMEVIQYNKSDKNVGRWSDLYQQRYEWYVNGLHLKTFQNENQNFEIKIEESLINYNNYSYNSYNTKKRWGSDRFVVEFPSKNQTYDYNSNDNKIKFSVKNTTISEVNFKNNKIKLIQDNSGRAIISSINAYHSFKSPIENIRIRGINGSFKNKKFSGEIIFHYLKSGIYDTTEMYLAKYKNNIFDDSYFNSGSYKFEKKGNDYYVTDYWISKKDKINFKDFWKSENKVKYFEGTYSEMELNEYSVNEWGEKKIKKTFTEWLPQGYKQYYDKEGKKKLSIFFDEGLPIEKKSICFDENGELTTCKTKTVFANDSFYNNRYVTEFKRGPSYKYYLDGNPRYRIDYFKKVENLLKNFDDFNQYLLNETMHMIGEYYTHKFLKEKLSHQTLKSVDLIYESQL